MKSRDSIIIIVGEQRILLSVYVVSRRSASETTSQHMELAVSGCRFFDNSTLINTNIPYDRCINADGNQSLLPLPFTRLMLDLDAAREEIYLCETTNHVMQPNSYRRGLFNGQAVTLFSVSTISRPTQSLPQVFELAQPRPAPREPRAPGAAPRPKKASPSALHVRGELRAASRRCARTCNAQTARPVTV